MVRTSQHHGAGGGKLFLKLNSNPRLGAGNYSQVKFARSKNETDHDNNIVFFSLWSE